MRNIINLAKLICLCGFVSVQAPATAEDLEQVQTTENALKSVTRQSIMIAIAKNKYQIELPTAIIPGKIEAFVGQTIPALNSRITRVVDPSVIVSPDSINQWTWAVTHKKKTMRIGLKLPIGEDQMSGVLSDQGLIECILKTVREFITALENATLEGLQEAGLERTRTDTENMLTKLRTELPVLEAELPGLFSKMNSDTFTLGEFLAALENIKKQISPANPSFSHSLLKFEFEGAEWLYLLNSEEKNFARRQQNTSGLSAYNTVTNADAELMGRDNWKNLTIAALHGLGVLSGRPVVEDGLGGWMYADRPEEYIQLPPKFRSPTGSSPSSSS